VRNGLCACFSGDEEQGYKYAVGQKGGDLRAVTKAMNQALNGRGGGKPEFVQGSVRSGEEAIRAYFASL
jgi:alanyl-tRNA synthetase